MDISRKWLSDYVALNCDDATLCHKLTMAGIEVEAVENNSTIPDGVVAAKIWYTWFSATERGGRVTCGFLISSM